MFPSKQEFLKQAPGQQSEIFTRAILKGAGDFFVAYLSCVDILTICRGRMLNKTFFSGMVKKGIFGAVTAKTEFLKAYIRQLKLGITVEEFQEIIADNLGRPFEDFLRILEAAKSRQVLQRDPSVAITVAELNIMLDIRVRRQVLPYLYERNISAESWMALGWTMVVNTELDYGGIAFRNERTQILVVVYDKDNSVEAEARAFFESLVVQYPGYTFIHTAKDHACLVAANIAKSKDQSVYLFERELSSLNPVPLTEFDFRMTNIKTDGECNTEDWLKNLRKNIVYLPTDFPVNVLCAAVYTRWVAIKLKVFDCLCIQSIDELASFKVGGGGFDWTAYFKSVAYTGKPEKFLLIIRPSERPSPEFYRILLEGAVSRVLRQQKVGVSKVQSQFELATLVLAHSGLTAESIENLRGIVHESFLRGSYLSRDFSALDPQELDKLKASGLLEFDSVANSYKFVSNAVYWLLVSQFLLKDFAGFRKNIEIEFKKFSEKDPSCNVFYFNVLSFLYSAVNKPSEASGIIEKYLHRDNLPAEVKARCYEFFPALYDSSAMLVFFFEYLEYSRYMPYSLIDEYHDHLDALQKPSAGKSSGASAFL